MDSENRKLRRKRNRIRKKMGVKEKDLERVVARLIFLKLTNGEKHTQEFTSLKRQQEAVAKKLRQYEDVLASLSPPIKL